MNLEDAMPYRSVIILDIGLVAMFCCFFYFKNLTVVTSLYFLLAVLQDQPGSKQKSISFFEHDKSSNELIPACIEIPTDGTDEWEIDVTQLKIEKKVASGSYGDL